MLFNSNSTTCRLGHHGVWIRALPFLHMDKEPLLQNYLKNTFIYRSLCLPSHVLISTLHNLNIYWHPLYPFVNLIYVTAGHFSCNGGLPPLGVFIYWSKPVDYNVLATKGHHHSPPTILLKPNDVTPLVPKTCPTSPPRSL